MMTKADLRKCQCGRTIPELVTVRDTNGQVTGFSRNPDICCDRCACETAQQLDKEKNRTN